MGKYINKFMLIVYDLVIVELIEEYNECFVKL